MVMGHGLGGQIALVHALGAVLTRRAAVLVNALGLALAAAHASAAGSEGGRPHNTRRHGVGWMLGSDACRDVFNAGRDDGVLEVVCDRATTDD